MSERSFEQWITHQLALHPRGIDLGLERVREVAGRLGIVHSARRVITVAGTNGKGSTVAFCESLALAHGLRVACYTSPHLLRYTERLRIDGRESAESDWLPAFTAVEAARGQTSLSFFEFGTLAVLWIMQSLELDLAVLEVGLGGRLDAVNIIDADASIITSIGLDHQDYLGDTLDQIAVEKAGVMRAGRPAIIAAQQGREVLLEQAGHFGARVHRPGQSYRLEQLETSGTAPFPRWRWSTLQDPAARLEFTLPGLPLAVMAENAAAALTCYTALGLPLDPDRGAAALAATRVAGRMQVLSRTPLVIADVAHNPAAAAALAEGLARLRSPNGRVIAVFSALADKDAAGIVQALEGQVDLWVLCGLPDLDRGLRVGELLERVASLRSRASNTAEPEAAIRLAQEAAQPADLLVCVGSFAVVSAAVRVLSRSLP